MVKDYTASCTTCACTKSVRHKPYGKLKQLLIPSQPWSSILMDFIEQLPASEDFSAILVVVDCCRRDNGSMCVPLIYASFGPQNITVIMSQESQIGRASCRE